MYQEVNKSRHQEGLCVRISASDACFSSKIHLSANEKNVHCGALL